MLNQPTELQVAVCLQIQIFRKTMKFNCIVLFVVLAAAAVAEQAYPARLCVSHKPIRPLSRTALPGFSTAFSQNGLDYFRGVGLQLLSEKLNHLKVPDITGVAKVWPAKFNYNVSSIHLEDVDLSSSTIEIVPGVGLSITVTKGSTKGDFNWHWQQQGIIHPHGTGTANLTVALSANMKFTFAAVNDHLQLDAVDPTVTIDTLQVHVNSKNSWFYNFLIEVLTPVLKNNIANQLNKAIQTTIESKLNELLLSVPIRQTIRSPLIFDIGLLRDPQFSADSFRLYESGESYDSSNVTECPDQVCVQRVLPDTTTQRMAQVYVSDYVANSMGYAAYLSGMIAAQVTPDMVPSTSPFKLDTGSLKAVLPPLYEKYPNSPVILNISASRPPAVTFNSTGVTVTVFLKIDFYVETSSGRVYALSVQGDISGPATVLTNNSIVYPKLGKFLPQDWVVLESSMGDINIAKLTGAIKFIVSYAVNTLNIKYASGVSLPTVDGLEFVNPTLNLSEGFLSLEVDFVFHPSS
ncbi:lipopolysaccharide-binding protein [Planoprotostelium fungivorum]|uniref:Lipopolysaccharide-binding protein n=1 Tax=Planoprotostelium fungivorum TaxID=1890364 RepID=A0A2P6NG02_9EUKA|nr:lipopolysaccharide-binding protein [Planoprotostelium fungivorum]